MCIQFVIAYIPFVIQAGDNPSCSVSWRSELTSNINWRRAWMDHVRVFIQFSRSAWVDSNTPVNSYLAKTSSKSVQSTYITFTHTLWILFIQFYWPLKRAPISGLLLCKSMLDQLGEAHWWQGQGDNGRTVYSTVLYWMHHIIWIIEIDYYWCVSLHSQTGCVLKTYVSDIAEWKC